MSIRAVAALLVGALSLSGPVAAQDTFPAADRIVAVGDVHGDFGQFVTVLRQAGLIDERNRWIGGRTHLVQTGDVPDRGPDTRKVLELLMELEGQAAKAGGQVHALIGNHEAMNILGDLRYVTPAEYEAFRSGTAEALQQRAFKALADSTRKDDAAYREQWLADHPLGWVEHRLAYEGNGRYGTWIRGHQAAIRIGDYLFVHGGIGPKVAGQSLAEMNRAVRQSLEPGANGAAAMDPEGPLWYRGLTGGDQAPSQDEVDQMLTHFGAKHLVIGHTPTAGAVMPRYEGRVIMVDVGMSAAYGGPPASLVIEGGVPYALHRGTRLPLPMGGDILAYLKAAAALDPQPSRLSKLIDQLGGVVRQP